MEHSTSFDDLFHMVEMGDQLKHVENDLSEFLYGSHDRINTDMEVPEHHNNVDISKDNIELHSMLESKYSSDACTSPHDTVSGSLQTSIEKMVYDSSWTFCEIQSNYDSSNELTYQMMNTVVRISKFLLY